MLSGASRTSCRFTNGMPNAFSSSYASWSVFAVVTNVMSMPKIRATLSTSISGNIVCSLMPDRVVAAAVERLVGQPAEVADPGDRDADEAVEELVHRGRAAA